MADIRSKAVWNELAPLYEESFYGIDIAATQMREPLGMADQIGIPSISALTVNTSGAVDATPEAITNSELTLNANREPWINAKLPQVTSMALDGTWANQTAAQAVSQLKNSMDTDYFKYLLERAYTSGTANTYHANVDGSGLTSGSVATAVATLLNNKGVNAADCVLMTSSWGQASLTEVAGFVPNQTQPDGMVNGLPMVGRIFNIPVYQTSAIPNGRTVASTAFADDGSDMVITVGSGHGIVKGMNITFDTVTAANAISSAAEVTSTSATTVTVASVNTASATEAGTITVESSENLLIAKNHSYVAQQKLPATRIVDLSNSTGSALQVSAVWGMVARAGYQVVLHTPKSAV